MQWKPGAQAGFSTNPQTWLPVAPDFKTVNVQTESGDAESLLEWNEKLIALRRSNVALHDGGLTMLDSGPNVLAYVRRASGGHVVLVVMNMSSAPQVFSQNEMGKVHTLAASDASLRSVTAVEQVTLPPYSSWVVQKD